MREISSLALIHYSALSLILFRAVTLFQFTHRNTSRYKAMTLDYSRKTFSPSVLHFAYLRLIDCPLRAWCGMAV